MDCIDVCYKKLDQLSIHLNVYPPNLDSRPPSSSYPRLPAVVYFHGGGLTVGNRTSWLPTWLKERLVSSGIVFISADYRLVPSVSIHEIIDDIEDLFSFLRREDLCFKTETGYLFGVDPESIAVAGSSAGGGCAYQAALRARPRPKAVLALYATLGDTFLAQDLIPKTKPFFLGRELLDPRDFSEFLYPNCESLEYIADSPLAYHPPTSATPGFPANPRMPLSRLYLQMGVSIDYFTGQHEPSLSAILRPLLQRRDLASDSLARQEAAKALIPLEHHIVFPQFHITPEFPPTFLCHGEKDSAVPVQGSEHMHKLLQRAGVPSRLLVIKGAEHSLDYAPDAEALYGSYLDEIVEFLREKLAD